MIVKCERCQTKFKIPDDKVTDKGVKVRCTKCQHTFRVNRAGPVDAAPAGERTVPVAPAIAPAAPVPEANPFAQFAALGDGPAPPTRPGVYLPGLAQSRDPGPLAPSFDAQRHVPSEEFEAPTKVATLPASVTAAARAQAQTWSAPPPAAEEPSSGDATSPGMTAGFDLGLLAAPGPAASSVVVKAPPGANPFDFAAALELPDRGVGFAPPAQEEAPPPAPPAPRPALYPAEQPSFEGGDPFADLQGALDDALPIGAPVAAPPPPLPPPPAPKPAPTSRSGSGFAPVSTSRSGSALPPVPTSRSGASLAPVPAPPSAPRPRPQPAPAPSLGETSLEQETVTRQTLPTQPAVEIPEDPGFDGPGDFSAPPADAGLGELSQGSARAALFDMPAAPAPEPMEPSSAPTSPEVETTPAPPPEAIAPAAEPAEAPPQERSFGSRYRTLSMVVNVAIAAVLLLVVTVTGMVFLNEGKLEASSFTPSRLGALFFSRPDLVAVDLSNGLYETSGGRPVFYVRGEVKNRGAGPVRARVRAEILDGETLVRTGDAWAWAAPTPAELSQIRVAEDVERLNQRADTAKAVDPGGRAPFVIAFYEYPSDLRGFRVRVTVTPAEAATAAR